MRERSYKVEAIIIARRNFGEADRMLTLITKNHGKLRAIAKGIRRPTSRKRGNLELFSQVVMFLAKGKNLDIVTEVEIKKSFNSWRRDLLRVGIAYHLCEVVNKLTRESQEARRVYGLLADALSGLGNTQAWQLHQLTADFKENVLKSLGFLGVGKSNRDLDSYIEELTQSKLKTRRFLKSLI